MGPRLLIIAQGEDFQSHSLYDAAYFVVTDYPEEAPIPAGVDLYVVMATGPESEPPE
jgi:hypothetical protein